MALENLNNVGGKMKIGNYESHPYADIFPMIDGDELENLKEDIKTHGLLQPIILLDNKILDGRNRYKACIDMGIVPTFETYTGDKPLEYVISLNLKRRHLTQSQKGVIALDVLPMLEVEAKKRMLHGDPRVKIPEGSRSSEQAGKLFNVSEKYVREAKKLKETSPELLEEVRTGRKNFSEIYRDQRIEKIIQQRRELETNGINPPDGLYDVIVIDPPWGYEGDKYPAKKDEFGKFLPHYNREFFRGTAPYPTMTLEEIKNIQLPAKDDCVLWLWTTNLFILDCKELLETWGFTIKSVLTWDKVHFGLGRWLRAQTEHCILAVRGRPYFQNTTYSTLLRETRTPKHSEKPDSFYTMVDKICAGRKLDYFARKKRDGWDVYGDEVNKEDTTQ